MFKLTHHFKGYRSNSLVQPPKTIEMTLDTEEASIEELCEFFGDFLKACTYNFDGQIQLVDDSAADWRRNTLESLRDDFESLDSLHNNENVDGVGYEPIAEEETPKPVQTEFNFGATPAPEDNTGGNI